MRLGSGDEGEVTVMQKLQAKRDIDSANARRRRGREGDVFDDICQKCGSPEGSRLARMQYGVSPQGSALFTSVYAFSFSFEAY